MNITGKDEYGKNIVNALKVPRKFIKYKDSNVCEKWLYAGLSHMRMNLFPLLMIKVKLM